MAELFSLRGRTAVVTGASSGIGRAMAGALAEAGASVVLTGRRADVLARAEQDLASRGWRCAAIPADLADLDALGAAADRFAAAFGEPDVLVNAAAVNIRPPLDQFTVADWDTTMAVDLTAPFLLGQRFGPSMASRGHGRIINVCSQQSFRAFGNSGGYGAAKAGLMGLTRSQAEAWSRYGVCCNAIVPGLVRTPMTEPVFAVAGRAEALVARTLSGRNGTVADFRAVAVFLASEGCGYITGAAIFVDGGFAAG